MNSFVALISTLLLAAFFAQFSESKSTNWKDPILDEIEASANNYPQEWFVCLCCLYKK